LSDDEYAKLYSTVSSGHWEEGIWRIDQQYVIDTVKQHYPKGASVLDVGCFTGDLLARLPANCLRFGIEPADQAAKKASARNIHIIGSTHHVLSDHDLSFDVISALNVIEHVPNPLKFVQLLASKLKPGGLLLIGSGDSESPAWRFLGPSYWYSQNFEHISFVSGKWSTFAAKRSGLKISHFHDGMRYGDGSYSIAQQMFQWLKLAIKASLSFLERHVLARFPSEAQRTGTRLIVGRPGMFADHFLVTFQKP
jgi:SAM-dependent methyltransferase